MELKLYPNNVAPDGLQTLYVGHCGYSRDGKGVVLSQTETEALQMIERGYVAYTNVVNWSAVQPCPGNMDGNRDRQAAALSFEPFGYHHPARHIMVFDGVDVRCETDACPKLDLRYGR